jgi:hypothetical protein
MGVFQQVRRGGVASGLNLLAQLPYEGSHPIRGKRHGKVNCFVGEVQRNFDVARS